MSNMFKVLFVITLASVPTFLIAGALSYIGMHPIGCVLVGAIVFLSCLDMAEAINNDLEARERHRKQDEDWF